MAVVGVAVHPRPFTQLVDHDGNLELAMVEIDRRRQRHFIQCQFPTRKQDLLQVHLSNCDLLLRQYSNTRQLCNGKLLHAHILNNGHAVDRMTGNLLMQMYAKCDDLLSAELMFDQINSRNIFTWTIMVGAYSTERQLEQALLLFRAMRSEGISPNKFTFSTLLTSFSSGADFADGKWIHAYMISSGLESSVVLETALLNMYANCGCVNNAEVVFRHMPVRNVPSWNTMIAAYALNEQNQNALILFQKMLKEGANPDIVTCINSLNACANLINPVHGKKLHAFIVQVGFASNSIVANAILNMYGKCNCVSSAWLVFSHIGEKTVVSWTAMIAAYAQDGHLKRALELLQKMRPGVLPNTVTFVSILDACVYLSHLPEGKRAHAYIINAGFTTNILVETALVNMYGKCGSVEDASRIFERMLARNLVSWNAMISTYVLNGCGNESVYLFHIMQLEGIMPNTLTFVSLLDGCAEIMGEEVGRMVHAHIISFGLEIDVILGTTLVNVYGKCKNLKEALQVFETLPERNLISWNAIIGAYDLDGCGQQVLQLFESMHFETVIPNAVTFSAVFSACGSLAAVGEAKRMHAYAISMGFGADVVMGTIIIDMYAKCGSLEAAGMIFDIMHERNIVSWTTIVAAYGQSGLPEEALAFFREMQLEGVMPQKVTFVNILSACSHGGLFEDGCYHFIGMRMNHGSTHAVEHYGCLVDLLGRAGWLSEAEDLINTMPFEPIATTWMAMLAACKVHGDMQRGNLAAEFVSALDPENAASYILLASIYMYATNSTWAR